MARILICGGDSWANRGDNAILAGTLETLRKTFPEAEVTVASDRPEVTARVHRVRAVRRMSLSFLTALWRCQLVLWGGGQLLQNASSKVFLLFQLGILLVARILGKKVMCFAQGVGPVQGTLFRFLCRLLVNGLELITVRDEASRADLEALGIKRPPIYVTADPVLALSPASLQRGQEIMRFEGVAAPFVVITVRRWGHYQGGWLPVRFVARLRRWPPGHTAQFETIKTQMALLADHIVEKLGAQVLFVPMCPGGDQEDDLISQDVHRRMIHKERAHVLQGDYSPGELMALLGYAEMVVGMRTHSIILASAMGVPVVSLSYQGKGESFLKTLEQGEYAISVENMTFPILRKTVDRAWANRKRIRGEISRRVNELRASARQNGAMARALYAGSRARPKDERHPHKVHGASSSVDANERHDRLMGVMTGFDNEARRWERAYRGPAWGRALLPALFSKTVAARRELCLKLSEVKGGQIVLDLGCGPGAYAEEVREAGGFWVGLDYSKEMVGLAKEHLTLGGTEKGALVLGEAGRLPLADATVDTVICAGLADYVPLERLPSLTREMSRVLKERGCLVVTSNLHDPFRWLRSRLPAWVPRPFRVMGPAFFHSEALPIALRLAGFQILHRQVHRASFLPGGTLLLKCLKHSADLLTL